MLGHHHLLCAHMLIVSTTVQYKHWHYLIIHPLPYQYVFCFLLHFLLEHLFFIFVMLHKQLLNFIWFILITATTGCVTTAITIPASLPSSTLSWSPLKMLVLLSLHLALASSSLLTAVFLLGGGTGIGSHERHSQRRRGGGGPVVTDTRGSGAYYHYFIHDVGDDTMPGC